MDSFTLITDRIPSAIQTAEGDIQIVSITERDRLRDLQDIEKQKPQPMRMTFIQTQNFCQFCKFCTPPREPEGAVFANYISMQMNFGFVSCTLCSDTAKEAKAEWISKEAFGKANHLKNTDIKIRRSSGIIESGWRLNEKNPLVIPFDFVDCVECIDSTHTITRYSSINELLELNNQIG